MALITSGGLRAQFDAIVAIANKTTTPMIILGGLGVEPSSPLLDKLLGLENGKDSYQLFHSCVHRLRPVQRQWTVFQHVGPTHLGLWSKGCPRRSTAGR